VFDHLAQARFGLSIGVNPGGIEIADASVDGSVDVLDRLFLRAAMCVHNPLPTKTQNRKRFSGFTKWSGFHDNLLLPTSNRSIPSVLKKISRSDSILRHSTLYGSSFNQGH